MKERMFLTLATLIAFGFVDSAFPSSDEDVFGARINEGNQSEQLMPITRTEADFSEPQQRKLPWPLDTNIHLKIMGMLPLSDILSLASVNWSFNHLSKMNIVMNRFFFNRRGSRSSGERYSAADDVRHVYEALKLNDGYTIPQRPDPVFEIHSRFLAPALGALNTSIKGKTWYLNNSVHPLAQYSIIGSLMPSRACLNEQENPETAIVAFINGSANRFKECIEITHAELLIVNQGQIFNHASFLYKMVTINEQALITGYVHRLDRYRAIKACLGLTPEQIRIMSSPLFTASMDLISRACVITACLKLTPKQINARAHAISINAEMLFTASMSRQNRAYVITACLKLTPEQIRAIPFHLFTENMDEMNRLGVIIVCLKLTPEEILERLNQRSLPS